MENDSEKSSHCSKQDGRKSWKCFMLKIKVFSVVYLWQLYLYCIVTGSCRPYKRLTQMLYMYELDAMSELFVVIVF